MKITTRGKGILAYKVKTGVMSVDFVPNKGDKVWLKMDVSGKEQYIIELEKFDVARLIAIGLQDKEIFTICQRNGWLKLGEEVKLHK